MRFEVGHLFRRDGVHAWSAALLPVACWVSVLPQPFWANTVAVYLAISWSLGSAKRVSDAVVLCVRPEVSRAPAVAGRRVADHEGVVDGDVGRRQRDVG